MPDPVAGDVKVIQLTSDDAVQTHPPSVAMLNVLEPPLAPVPWVDGDRAYRHVARCETRACSPLTTITPSRDEALSLGATRNDTVLEPCPDDGDSDEIQAVEVAAAHVHSGCVVIASEPEPPTASSAGGDTSATPHFTGLGPALIEEEVVQPEIRTAAQTDSAALNDA